MSGEINKWNQKVFKVGRNFPGDGGSAGFQLKGVHCVPAKI